MIDSPVITRENFHTAVSAADIATIEAFFAQPHVRTEVEETNASIIETQAATVYRDPATFTLLRDGSCPWFRRPKLYAYDTGEVPLVTAARDGHVPVVAWVFARERASFMGATLAFLLPLVTRFDDRQLRKYWRARPCDTLVLETLLESPVFREYIPAGQKQAILDEIASQSETPALIQLAIAHGARVNEAVLSIARHGTVDCVAVLEDAGALLVGADVFQAPRVSYPKEYQCADAFLQCGVDWGAGSSRLVIDVCHRGADSEISKYLTDGFVDVDARDAHGKTALMHVASLSSVSENHPIDEEDTAPWMARTLLRYCDVHLVDARGCTALHYAAHSNAAITELLLESGADPNARDVDGRAAFDGLADFPYAVAGWSQLLKRFLMCGADPFFAPTFEFTCAPSEERNRIKSMFETLNESVRGREFINCHSGFFTRDDD